MLPFLKKQGLPKLRKLSGESKYGFSEDDELIEHSLNELMQAVESKDHMKMSEAIKALIDCIMAKEGNQDADDEKASIAT